MKKKFMSIILGLSMVFAITNSVSAKEQLGNAEVLIGSIDINIGTTHYGTYCTATQSHVNLRVDVTDGSAHSIPQYRAPHGDWTNLQYDWEFISGHHTFNINAKDGYDYRVKTKPAAWSTEAQVWCW